MILNYFFILFNIVILFTGKIQCVNKDYHIVFKMSIK